MHRIQKAYEEYFSTVQNYLLFLTGGNHDLAEELTQETFYRAVKNIHRFEGKSKISTWLCQIAKYTFYQYLEKKKRRHEVPLEEAFDIAYGEEVEQAYIQNETKKEFYEKIASLNDAMREVLMLRLSGELSFREIGDIFGKTENWARVTFYRGKEIIGKELQEHDISK